ncbi:type IV pilus assembly protein PilM [Phosphitispora fastidiosa]|uniref:type IV pilus assembly protein PilM n=1 Tax=Phosphitispora fastidiosa TaxID=2837202 RepID=UPI001E2FC4D1|nr:type IV pilus assembly protein PilM [Phosphitispora fastidiosa]MBU7008767.1 type IV pilus assembly protein PilM [Phosphitispora fastidiosa]
MGLFSKKGSIIGLDIGEQSIKLAEVRKSGGSYEIINFAMVPTPGGCVSGGNITNAQSLILALQKVQQFFPGEMPRVATAISGDSVLIRHFNMPAMPEKEMTEAVKYEVEAQLSIPSKEIVVDFMKVGEVSEGGVKKNEIMVVAARNEIINHYVNIIKSIGFEPVVMDVDPLALLRTVEIVEGPAKMTGCFAVVDIGAGTTNISIFDNKVLRFTRGLTTAGNKITNALVNHYGISFEEAESTKKLVDLSGSIDNKGLSVLLYQKAEIMSPVISELINELGRSLEFFMTRHRELRVDRMYISGGGALFKGLAGQISDELELPVQVLNPAERMNISPKLQHREKEIKEAGSALAVVVGLAVSEVE